MLTRLIFAFLLNLVCLHGICQTFMVCEVSGQPAAVTYKNGSKVLANDRMSDNKILIFSKNSSIAFMHMKSKDMYFFAGEGEYVVSDLIKANKNRVKSRFTAFIKEQMKNNYGFRQAGVVYKNEADSIMDWGAGNVSLCNVKGEDVSLAHLQKGDKYYFVVSNPTDSMAFVNVVACYDGGEEKLCCLS